MEFFIGVKGRDFVMLCGDTAAAHSVITIKQDEDKIVPIDDFKLMALAGEPGDRVNFSDYIIANVKLYELKNSKSLTTKAVANFTRNELATALRKVCRLAAAPAMCVAEGLWRKRSKTGCWRCCICSSLWQRS